MKASVARCSSVSLLDAGHLEELGAEVVWLVDPAGLALLLGDLVEPVLVGQARLGAVDFLKPDVLSQLLQLVLVDQVLALALVVDDAHAAVLVGQREHVDGDEVAELAEDGDDVLVAGTDLLVGLQAALLKDRVERGRLLDALLVVAVEQGEHLEDVDVDLIGVLSIALELGREEHLGERALRVKQGPPGVRRQRLAKRLQRDVRLDTVGPGTTVLRKLGLLSLLNLLHHGLDLYAAEGQRLLEPLILVADALPLDLRQVLHLLDLNHRCLFTSLTGSGRIRTDRHRGVFVSAANSHLSF